MHLEEMCVSFELAKKLKEVNIPQDSLFVWSDSLRSNYILRSHPGICGDYYCAYSTDELIQLLPEEISLDSFYEHMKLTIQKEHKYYRVYYEANYFTYLDQEFEGLKLADCLAQMLIYIKELKLEKPE